MVFHKVNGLKEINIENRRCYFFNGINKNKKP